MSIPAKPFLFQDYVKVLKLMFDELISSPYIGHVLWLNWYYRYVFHVSVVALQGQRVWIDQGPNFTRMQHHGLHSRAVHMDTWHLREVVGCENKQQLPELLPDGFHTSCDRKFTAQQHTACHPAYIPRLSDTT